MRRSLILLIVASLVAMAVATPALAGKKKQKRKEKTYEVSALPYPITGEVQENGCNNGQEGVHKVSEPFKAPATGLLEIMMEGFDGDWDLHLLSADGTVLASSVAGQPLAPPGEEIVMALRKGTEVSIVACNWLGGPSATVTYVYTYRA